MKSKWFNSNAFQTYNKQMDTFKQVHYSSSVHLAPLHFS